MGAGRTELVTSLFGAYPGSVTGTILLNGRQIRIRSPKDAIRNGIGLITEDRKNFGVIPTASIREKMSMASLNRLPGCIVINDPEERLLCNRFIAMLKIKLGTLENRITSLSGGNQQKVIIREASFMGGEVTVFGAIIGSLIMASLNTYALTLRCPPRMRTSPALSGTALPGVRTSIFKLTNYITASPMPDAAKVTYSLTGTSTKGKIRPLFVY